MSLSYEIENRIKALSPILDEYSEWYGRVVRRSFYPSDTRLPGELARPVSFKNWVDDPARTDFVEDSALDKMKSLTAELHEAANRLMEDGSATDGAPDMQSLDDFINLHDEFVTHIRRVERDSLLADSGIDTLTGLRTADVMAKDLDREMERLSRRGKPFCIVLCRIDYFPEILARSGQDMANKIVVESAKAVKACLRTYDDSYYMGGAEFLMCLKHADVDGGMAAVERLRRILEELSMPVDTGQGDRILTLSFVTAEPQQGDEAMDLVGLLQDDLDKSPDECNLCLQYYEVSPLKRYIQNSDQ
jgi:diguanylate cyclase (GGDEF)-like protein